MTATIILLYVKTPSMGQVCSRYTGILSVQKTNNSTVYASINRRDYQSEVVGEGERSTSARHVISDIRHIDGIPNITFRVVLWYLIVYYVCRTYQRYHIRHVGMDRRLCVPVQDGEVITEKGIHRIELNHTRGARVTCSALNPISPFYNRILGRRMKCKSYFFRIP